MKTLLLGIVIAVILIATVPAIRDSGRSGGTRTGQSQGNSAHSATPLQPSTGLNTNTGLNSEAGGPATYRSPLGASGGLGGASMSQGTAGARQVHTLESLGRASNTNPGDVVRIRLSRANFTASTPADGWCYVNFTDKDLGGMIKVRFPTEGAVKLDLIDRHTAPGLSFYMRIGTEYEAVGTDYRISTQTYTW